MCLYVKPRFKNRFLNYLVPTGYYYKTAKRDIEVIKLLTFSLALEGWVTFYQLYPITFEKRQKAIFEH